MEKVDGITKSKKLTKTMNRTRTSNKILVILNELKSATELLDVIKSNKIYYTLIFVRDFQN